MEKRRREELESGSSNSTKTRAQTSLTKLLNCWNEFLVEFYGSPEADDGTFCAIVLVLSGALNPVHRAHVQMLLEACQALEECEQLWEKEKSSSALTTEKPREEKEKFDDVEGKENSDSTQNQQQKEERNETSITEKTPSSSGTTSFSEFCVKRGHLVFPEIQEKLCDFLLRTATAKSHFGGNSSDKTGGAAATSHAPATARTRVIGGILAPSSESYVRGKLGLDAMKINPRCELCEIATEDIKNISTVDYDIASATQVCATAYADLVKLGFPEKRLWVIPVYGSDFLHRYVNVIGRGNVIVERKRDERARAAVMELKGRLHPCFRFLKLNLLSLPSQEEGKGNISETVSSKNEHQGEGDAVVAAASEKANTTTTTPTTTATEKESITSATKTSEVVVSLEELSSTKAREAIKENNIPLLKKQLGEKVALRLMSYEKEELYFSYPANW